jgi:hypothetical protein
MLNVENEKTRSNQPDFTLATAQNIGCETLLKAEGRHLYKKSYKRVIKDWKDEGYQKPSQKHSRKIKMPRKWPHQCEGTNPVG